MKNTVIALLAALLVCSCSKQPSPQTYDNPEIGLRITYPGTWQVINKEVLNDAIAAAKKQMTISQDTVGIARAVVPSIVLSIAKPQKARGTKRNPNMNVLVIPVPEDEWGDVDLNSLVKEQIADIKLSIPGAEVTTNVFPLPNYPTIHNYSSRIPLQDRTVTQYQYVYWHPPYFVQVAFSFSHPDDEQEIREIIGSMKIERSNRSTGGDVQ